MTGVRFLADAMLGRLARYLRFLGYDVLYFRDMEDSQLVRIARAEDRVLLTRDRGIPQRFRLPCILLESEEVSEQLKQITRLYPPEEDLIGSRCILCNEQMVPITKEEARDNVPEYVLHTHKEFFRCPGCGRFYWRGSHMKDLQERVNEILQKD